MLKQNPKVSRAVVLAFLLGFTNASLAQADRNPERDVSREIDLRYADHRRATASVAKSMDRYKDFMDNEFVPAMEEELRSMGPTGKPDIPPSIRLQMVRHLKDMTGVTQVALAKSKSYSKFERDEAECYLWADVMQYYVDGLGALADEMSKSDLPASAFAGMAMNQVPTGLLGVSSLHSAVLPCFLEKGKYVQPMIAVVREKAEELRGTKSPDSPAEAP